MILFFALYLDIYKLCEKSLLSSFIACLSYFSFLFSFLLSLIAIFLFTHLLFIIALLSTTFVEMLPCTLVTINLKKYSKIY